jgi:hypothetical protein
MKLQSAIEYLTTYGWAILIIGIVLVALFEIVTGTPQVQECILPAGFSCPSFYMTTSGNIIINLVQATQYPLKVTALGCNYPQSANTIPVNEIAVMPPNTFVLMPIGANYTFNFQCFANGTAFSGGIKSIYGGYLTINYTNAYTNLPNTVYGSVRVEVTSG